MDFLNVQAKKLKELGYTWEYNADGYKVMYKEIFVSAAGVKLPRSKPLHWRHAVANRKDNFESCVYEAQKHFSTVVNKES